MKTNSRFFKELLSIRSEYPRNEWAFSEFNEKFIQCLESFEAFDIINDIVAVLLDKNNMDYWNEVFEVLIILARKSGTTEVPEKLKLNWSGIKDKVKTLDSYNYRKYQELAEYYRIGE
jgi:hypothetical protein